MTTNYVCIPKDQTDTCFKLSGDELTLLDDVPGSDSSWGTVYTMHTLTMVLMLAVVLMYVVGKMLDFYKNHMYRLVEWLTQTLAFVLGLVGLIIAMGSKEDLIMDWSMGYTTAIVGTLFILPAHLLRIYEHFTTGGMD